MWKVPQNEDSIASYSDFVNNIPASTGGGPEGSVGPDWSQGSNLGAFEDFTTSVSGDGSGGYTNGTEYVMQTLIDHMLLHYPDWQTYTSAGWMGEVGQFQVESGLSSIAPNSGNYAKTTYRKARVDIRLGNPGYDNDGEPWGANLTSYHDVWDNHAGNASGIEGGISFLDFKSYQPSGSVQTSSNDEWQEQGYGSGQDWIGDMNDNTDNPYNGPFPYRTYGDGGVGSVPSVSANSEGWTQFHPVYANNQEATIPNDICPSDFVGNFVIVHIGGLETMKPGVNTAFGPNIPNQHKYTFRIYGQAMPYDPDEECVNFNIDIDG